MAAAHFRQVETGATKDWESHGMLQKHPFHSKTSELETGDSVIEYERGILIHKQGWAKFRQF